MKLETFRGVGRTMMVVSIGLFTAGLGIELGCSWFESKDHKAELNIKKEEAKIKAIETKRQADELYLERVRNMNDSEFAKYHAEAVAVANERVMKEAEDIRRKAESELVEVKLSCQNKIDEVKAECLSRVQKANRNAEKAAENYKAIKSLFDNQDEILEAKKAIDAANKANKRKADALKTLEFDD